MTAAVKLVLAVVQGEDAGTLVDSLIAAGMGATRIDAAGGFLRRENAVVFAATEEHRVPLVLATIRRACRRRVVTWFPPTMEGLIPQVGGPIEVDVGGAVVFVLPIERVEPLGRPVGPALEPSHAKEVGREVAPLGA